MMKPSKSTFLNVRGLQYHLRHWGESCSEKLFLLHGWMDVSASFQFTVDQFAHAWNIIAPDWRGFGLSEWSDKGYSFADYVADLDVILNQLAPNEPVNIVGHSMGGNIAVLYAGLRPEKVSSLVLAEGVGLAPSDPHKAPKRYLKWLEYQKNPPKLRPYSSFQEVSNRLIANTPGMREEHAQFLAQHWAVKKDSNTIELRADPRHKAPFPSRLRPDEIINFIKQIEAKTLWVHSSSNWLKKWFKNDEQVLNKYRLSYKYLKETTISNSSHMMHLDNPKKLAREIEEFMASTRKSTNE